MAREGDKVYDAQLAKALAHPLRARILERLEHSVASPSELAHELAAPLGNVSYHVRILAEAGLIELVRTTRRRGATEHHYRATTTVASRFDRPAGEPRDGEAEVGVREGRIDGDPIRESVEEVRDRVRAAREDDDESAATAHVTRTSLVLDELAWDELLHAVERLHDLALRLQLESAPRLRRVQHENEREANLVLMLFEGLDPGALRVLRGGVGERRGSAGRRR